MNAGPVRLVRVARPGLFALLVVAAACGGGGDSTAPNAPQAIARVSADSQTTAAGVKMAEPLVVLVTGGGGTPLANVAVGWAIGNGGGSLTDTVSTTDDAGKAKTTYTPGTTPGIARITAKAGSLPALQFTITLVAGPPKELQKFGFANPAVVAGSTLPFSVKLVDAVGNGIAGKVVNWASSGGTISATTSTTDAGGVATVSFTIGSDPGSYSLTATVDGVPPVTFSVTAIKSIQSSE